MTFSERRAGQLLRGSGDCAKRTAAAPTLGLLAQPHVQLYLVLLGDGAVALRLLQARELFVLVVRCIKGRARRSVSACFALDSGEAGVREKAR